MLENELREDGLHSRESTCDDKCIPLEQKRGDDRTGEKGENPEPKADEDIRIGRLEIHQNAVDSDGETS